MLIYIHSSTFLFQPSTPSSPFPSDLLSHTLCHSFSFFQRYLWSCDKHTILNKYKHYGKRERMDFNAVVFGWAGC